VGKDQDVLVRELDPRRFDLDLARHFSSFTVKVRSSPVVSPRRAKTSRNSSRLKYW